MKLKDWIKTKKLHEKEKNYSKALNHVDLKDISDIATPPIVNDLGRELPSSLTRSQNMSKHMMPLSQTVVMNNHEDHSSTQAFNGINFHSTAGGV